MIQQDSWLLDNKDDFIALEKWQRAVNLLSKMFGAPASFIVQHTPEGYQVVIASQQSNNPYEAGGVISPDTNIFCRRVVTTLNQLYVADALEDAQWSDNPEVADDGFRSYLGLPIAWPDGTAFGTICVMDYESTNYQSPLFELLEQFRAFIEGDLDMLWHYDEMRELSLTDDLTKLFNRRGFLMLAQQKLKLAKRCTLSLGLLYVDMDNLKEVNDQYGHGAGDQAIEHMAKCIRSALRESDVAARMGGDEFAILMVMEQGDELIKGTRRITEKLSLCLLDNPACRLSATVGDIEVPNGCEDIHEILALADKKMYEKKEKNRKKAGN